MSLDEYQPNLDSQEWLGQSAESSKESSEKFQEDKKRASSKAKKVQKDEKKAKKYDFLLAGFLLKIIVDKKYDSVLNDLILCKHQWYPSNFILWIFSLINIDISDKIRDIWNKKHIQFTYNISKESIDFNNETMAPEIKDRINFWVEDIIDSVIIEYSQVETKKMLELLITDNSKILSYLSKVFLFFLTQLNINISQKSLGWISVFIMQEVEKNIKKIPLEDL